MTYFTGLNYASFDVMFSVTGLDVALDQRSDVSLVAPEFPHILFCFNPELSLVYYMAGNTARDSACTIYSDYTFDPTVCWSVPSKADYSDFVGVQWYNPTPKCDHGPPITSHLPSSVITRGSSLSTWTGVDISFCDPSDVLSSVWTRWHFGSSGSSTWETTLPSSLEPYLPGSRDCYLKYTHTKCPDGHTALSSEGQDDINTMFCCPE